MDIKKIGMFIKEQRNSQNMTQKDLAEKIGCTDKAISRWETGKGLPDMSFIVPLSEALCVSVNELLSGESFVADIGLEKEKVNPVSSVSEIVKKTDETLINVMTDTASKTKSTTIKEILFGFLTSSFVWLSAFLFSGRIAFGDVLEFWDTGLIVFAFPLFFCLSCIAIGIYSSKTAKDIYFKASLLFLSVPFVSFVIYLIFSVIDLFFSIPYSELSNSLATIVGISHMPVAAVFSGIYDYIYPFHLSEIAETATYSSVLLIPAVVGLVISIRIYKKSKV